MSHQVLFVLIRPLSSIQTILSRVGPRFMLPARHAQSIKARYGPSRTFAAMQRRCPSFGGGADVTNSSAQSRRRRLCETACGGLQERGVGEGATGQRGRHRQREGHSASKLPDEMRKAPRPPKRFGKLRCPAIGGSRSKAERFSTRSRSPTAAATISSLHRPPAARFFGNPSLVDPPLPLCSA